MQIMNWGTGEEIEIDVATLRYCDLSYCNCHRWYLCDLDLTGARLRFIDGRSIRADRSILRHSDLYKANLLNSVFNECVGDYSSFAMADCRGCRFKSSILTNCNFTESHLGGAVMDGANLNGAVFTRATYTVETKWPAGFEPSEHNLILKPVGFG